MSWARAVPAAVVSTAIAMLLGGCLFATSPGATFERTLPPRNDRAVDPSERRMAELLTRSRSQRRPRLVYDPALARAARQKALDMARRGYYGHTDPDGRGANYHAERAGFRLPASYPRVESANNIESILAGRGAAEAAWEEWMESRGHRAHLLGLNDFYRSQTHYGVGYVRVPGSEYEHYWVVLISGRGE